MCESVSPLATVYVRSPVLPPPPPEISSVEVTFDYTLEKSGFISSVLLAPPWTLEKSGFLSLLIERSFPTGIRAAQAEHAGR